MKTPPLSNQRGVALVIVLVFLVLLSIFIVGFFSNSQDELTAAQSFTGEVSASHLAESAVSVVMGQIREATGRKNGAWGSQPGMIRVYRDGDTASAKADAFFKLYSSDDMIVGGTEIEHFDPANEVAEGAGTGWEHVPALWTNLNESVKVPRPNTNPVATVDRYPILDPSMDHQVEGLELLDNVPNAEATSKVQRARMPVKWLYVLKDGTLTAPSSSGNKGTQALWKVGEREPTVANPIVGRVAFWTDDESCKVNINTAGGYTTKPEDKSDDGGMPKHDARNQAIGEDEYPGSFWDTPRAMTTFDRGLIDNDGARGSSGSLDRGGLALSQPVRGEFQRYPGHPSTTSLGIVFRGHPANSNVTMQDAPYLLKSGQLALLAPRLMYSLTNKNERATNYGTSRLLAGDYRKDPQDPIESNDVPVSPRVKRLYASVDELFYAQPDISPGIQRKQNDWELAVAGVSQNDTAKILTADYLEKMRFFLTAHSRAPEVNLFGQPRVSIWPVWEISSTNTKKESDWWNASDRLIAFCSSIGPTDANKILPEDVKRYIFQRTDAYSSDYDVKSIKRNVKVLSYLRSLTDQPFPGVGGLSFKQKYADPAFGGDILGREQVLVEIFDYIRTVNMRDSTRDKKFNETVLPVGGAANIVKKERYKYAPRGIVIPARTGSGGSERRGIGRFPTISEASIVLYCSGYVGTDGKRYLNSRQSVCDANPNLDGYAPDRFVLDRDGRFVPPQGPPGNRIKVKDTLVRAFFVTEVFNPMQGYAPTTTPNGNSTESRGIIFEMENLNDFTFGGQSLAFPKYDPLTNGYNPDGSLQHNNDVLPYNEVKYSSGNLWGGRNSGGSEGFMHTMWQWPAGKPKAAVAPNAGGIGGTVWYPFQSDPRHPIMIDRNPVTNPDGILGAPIPYRLRTATLFGPSELKIKMYYGSAGGTPIRNIVLKFDATDVPVPTDVLWSAINPAPGAEGTYLARSKASAFNVQMDMRGGFVEDLTKLASSSGWSCNLGFKFYGIPAAPADKFYPKDRTAKSLGDWVDQRETISEKHVKPGRLTWIQNDSGNHSGDTSPGPDYERKWQQILQPGDVVRSLVFGDPDTGKGDLRKSCLAVNSQDTSSVFFKPKEYGDPTVRHAQTLRMSDSQLYYPDTFNNVPETLFGNIARLPSGKVYPAAQAADVPSGINGVARFDSPAPPLKPILGDFDTGIGSLADGPFCNKADEGNLVFRYRNNNTDGSFAYWTYPVPYFTWTYEEAFDTFFSPNRQVPSPVVFGSLLSGKGADWQTLCFCPNPAGANHPGIRESLGPKDSLWLDLFTMPVVEPYAISEPFSTAGKINLNYPIIPFGHIKRTTGLRAALQPLRVTAMPVVDVLTFKTGVKDANNVYQPVAGTNYRYLVDRDETLKEFDAFFDQYKNDHNKGFIKAGAQICDFYLYPRRNGQAVVHWVQNDTAIKQWWNQNALTGDNVREKPYGDLYPRITTKSNTFCVHVRAQALRQSAASDASKADAHYRTWDEKRDRVIGEYRGASIIERYIDPQDERFDTAPQNTIIPIDPDSKSIDTAYRFRVLNTKRFDP